MVETTCGRPSRSKAFSHAPGGSGTTTSVRVTSKERAQLSVGATKERSKSDVMAESQPAGITKTVLMIGRKNPRATAIVWPEEERLQVFVCVLGN